MGKNLVEKIIASHLISGEMKPGSPIVLKVDQTLGHDLTSIMAAQTILAVDVDQVKTNPSVFYCDHNTLCATSENTDDHLFLKSVAARYGLYFSKPGNGVCHFLHCERFAKPGEIVLGMDSHTPTSGALGMLAIGSGGLTVAQAALGEGFKTQMPKVYAVRLTGRLRPGVAAKDIALEMLRRLTVKGAVGCVFEFIGDGVDSLTISQRQTIANMTIEMGATTGVFPSDEETRAYLKAQDREGDYRSLRADADCTYDCTMDVDLSILTPLAAKPHMPDLVDEVRHLTDVKPQSVFIGSCTNGSYSDIAKAAALLKGRRVHKDIDCTVAPGSRQVLERLVEDGVLTDLIAAGCRILECACGPCVGVGQVPSHNGVTVRTSNRNFPGRSGNQTASVYLVSPETAAATAITGHLCDPRVLAEACTGFSDIAEPSHYRVDDCTIIAPSDIPDPKAVEIVKGPNISDLPVRGALRETIEGAVSIKLGDNITTDDIIPAGSSILKFIANIPEFAKYTFCYTDPDFVRRAQSMGHSIIVGGDNYGQGSSREHAALLPMYLGVEAVLAKSFARIHKENLINYGILPLTFENPADYERISQEDEIIIDNVLSGLKTGTFEIRIPTRNILIPAKLEVSDMDKELLAAGGAINYLSNKLKK